MLSSNVVDIKGYEGVYAISDDGRVYSHSRLVKASFGRMILMKGRWLKQNVNANGYLYVSLYNDNGRRNCLVHRIVAQHYLGNGEPSQQVNHIDGCKSNNSVANLEWVTPSGNVLHSYKIGIREAIRGEDNANAKITESDAKKIKELVSNGAKQCDVADQFGIHNSIVSRIVRGKAWRHVNDG